MKALILNCTLKPSPAKSNTEALANEVIDELKQQGIETEIVRVIDYNVPTGVETDLGEGDEWPDIHQKINDAEILIIASPTWLGHPSSVAQKALERMDAMISELHDSGLPVAYNKVAGVIVTGNEDGAHHVISEIAGGLMDIGYTIPGQAWTYWNKGPGPSKSYLENEEGHEWSAITGQTAASVLVAVAEALVSNPILPTAYRAEPS